MRMPSPRTLAFIRPKLRRGPVLLAMLLAAGCASNNPLIDDAPMATSASTSAATQSASAQEPENSGVHTSRQRRFLGFLSPYRPDIQQGNFVSREMVAQLKEGMTQDQVRFVMGTPTLNDIFHAERWDYPFRMAKGNGEIIDSRVTLHFKDLRLARIVGADLPNETEYLTLIDPDHTQSRRKPADNAQPANTENPAAPESSQPTN